MLKESKDKLKKNETLVKSSNQFPVVGIGASAGGLDAFKKLLKAIPEDSGMAYVLVQHLDPKHESLLPELLQKVTNIPVMEIADDVTVVPDHIYIIPSNKMLIANDGVLLLSPRPAKSKTERNLPIDLFFTSLAEVHQSHAIGVVLSGTASDGTNGLRAIKSHGGITFAQDEESAAYEGMPHSAVQAGVVDFILPPEKIPQKLLDIIRKVILSDDELQNIPQKDEDVYKQILSLLRLRKGTDFTYYKQTTIRRRILRRMALNKNEEPAAYLKYLRENKPEQDVLYQDLLIPVTEFFRDTKTFDNLCGTVFPLIVKNKTAREPIRIWVAGCSTGEEVYSIAICFKELLGDNQRMQIFATDISEPAVIKARSGIYKKSEIAGITDQRLQQFFTKSNGSFQVNKEVRDMCVFAVHNFLKDPPFGKVDFISCRNVLIYMEPYLQKKALTTFHYALNPEGFLLLGKSETASSVSELFGIATRHEKLFTRKDVSSRFMHAASQRGEQSFADMHVNAKSENIRTDFQKAADDILLGKYTPAGVVVNEAMDIVHFRGSTGNYLEPSPGKASLNLLKMAKNGLGFELRNILHKAKKDNAPVIKENIPLQSDSLRNSVNNLRNISIEAIPLPHIVEPHYLILFHEKSEAGSQKPEGGSKKTSSTKTKDADKDLRIQQLEKELAQNREDMRSITEDQEAVNEELQSANEELLSGSEELQSLNEEMETSKEELQSTNEELTVVNQEMIGLNEQVSDARDYAEAIIATVREPILVLDNNLRVKSANSAFYKTFRVNERETEGKLIYELGDKQWNIPELRTLLEEILLHKTKIADYEVTHNFQNLGERVMLLNAREITREKIEENLILLSFEDNTEKVTARKKIEDSNKRYYLMLMQSPFAFSIMKGKDMVISLANDLMKEFWGKGKEVEGKTLLQILPELEDQPFPGMMNTVYTTGNPVSANEILARLNHNGTMEERYFNIVYQPHLEADETISGVITIAHEVTNQVVARKKMEAQADMVNELLLTAPAFICTLTGPDHVHELVNERYQALFGKRKIKGKPIMEALPELKGQGFDTLLDKVYTTGETYVGIDIPIRIARDENLAPELSYFNFSYQPMYDEDRKIYSILVFGYETTEEVIARNKNLDNQIIHAKELEEKVQQRTFELSRVNEELQQKNEEFAKMNVELQAFSYISSHDLQEPLRKIQNFISRILDIENQNLTDKGNDYFRRIQEAANRMQTLIQDLLAFSLINNTDRKFENTDLNKIIEKVKVDLTEAMQEKNATIETRVICEAKIIPFQFNQLFTNLISNSLKFSTPAKPVHIIIKSKVDTGANFKNEMPASPVSRLSPQKLYCHISITDNGIGFDPQYKDRIFDVFQRLHGKEEYPGTGIGLSIVKKIVENHNGIIAATSQLEKGATFDIYIPG